MVRSVANVSCGECGGGERIRMELCAGKANWDVVRAEKSAASCAWKPRVTVGVKRNELSTHVRAGNELGGEQRELNEHDSSPNWKN